MAMCHNSTYSSIYSKYDTITLALIAVQPITSVTDGMWCACAYSPHRLGRITSVLHCTCATTHIYKSHTITGQVVVSLIPWLMYITPWEM